MILHQKLVICYSKKDMKLIKNIFENLFPTIVIV